MRAILILLVWILTAPVWAQTTDIYNSWWGFGRGMASPLGLTSEQMAAIREITTKWQEELQPLWFELQKKNLALHQLMWSVDPDPTEVEAKSKEVGGLQDEVRKKVLERQKALRDMLTDDQRARFDPQGLGAGWGTGSCGLGLGPGMAGRRGGFGRGRGGGGWGGRLGGAIGMGGLQSGRGAGNWGFSGRGLCGMGMGRSSTGNWSGRRRW